VRLFCRPEPERQELLGGIKAARHVREQQGVQRCERRRTGAEELHHEVRHIVRRQSQSAQAELAQRRTVGVAETHAGEQRLERRPDVRVGDVEAAQVPAAQLQEAA
jgi:hypothetical protein